MPNWRGVQNLGPPTEVGSFDDRTGRRRTVRRGVGPVGLSGRSGPAPQGMDSAVAKPEALHSIEG